MQTLFEIVYKCTSVVYQFFSLFACSASCLYVLLVFKYIALPVHYKCVHSFSGGNVNILTFSWTCKLNTSEHCAKKVHSKSSVHSLLFTVDTSTFQHFMFCLATFAIIFWNVIFVRFLVSHWPMIFICY